MHPPPSQPTKPPLPIVALADEPKRLSLLNLTKSFERSTRSGGELFERVRKFESGGGVLVLAFGCWHSKAHAKKSKKIIAEIEPHGVRRKRKKTLWHRVSHKMSDKRVYVPLLVQFRSCEKCGVKAMPLVV